MDDDQGTGTVRRADADGPDAAGIAAPRAQRDELILLVHGMGVTEREEALGWFAQGLDHYCLMRNLDLQPLDEEATSQQSYRLGGATRLDVREVYWGDLQPALSAQPLQWKLLRGVGLLAYWGRSLGLIRAMRRRPQLLLGAVFFLALFVLWYLVTFAAITGDEFSGWLGDGEFSNRIVDALVTVGGALTSWEGWVAVTLLVALLPVASTVDTAFASMAYLENRGGAREKALRRLARELAAAERAGYRRISVVAHSFGAVPAVETLAQFPATLPVRLFTLGSPLEIVQARSARVAQAVRRLTQHPRLERWCDYYSDKDWMCTRAPVAEQPPRVVCTEMPRDISILRRASARTHRLYFSDPPVFEAVLEGAVASEQRR